MGNPEGKTALGRPRCKYGENIKMNINQWDEGHGLD
jgi:hypothetical protein